MSKLQEDVAELMAQSGERLGRTRRPLFRIYEIHSAINGGGYPNCTKLATQLGVQRKTIQRDITFMRDELKLPLLYDESLHGYFYEKDVTDFPIFETTAENLAGLFLARIALQTVRGTALGDVMQQAFAKLTRGIQGKIDFAWADLDQAFTRKAPETSARDLELFGKLADVILHQLVTTFFYRKLGADHAELRRVQPLHLGEVEGGWYLIATDMDRGALRTFALPRMSRFKATTETFPRPADFIGADHLKQSFGIWSVAGDFSQELVRVELRGYAARLATERRWHPTQEILLKNAKGSRIEIRFEVGRLEEVLRWVLSFGSQAKVLDPPELVRMVREEIEAMRS